MPTNDYSYTRRDSYLNGDYSQYTLTDNNIKVLAEEHSRLKDNILNARDKSNTSEGYIGGGYVIAIVGPIIILLLLSLHVTTGLPLLGKLDLTKYLEGLKHLSKIFTTNNNGMSARYGVSAFFKLLLYAGLIVTLPVVGSKLMIIPHSRKYKQYKREKSSLQQDRDKVQIKLDKAQKNLG
jgi:hypothetical protein